MDQQLEAIIVGVEDFHAVALSTGKDLIGLRSSAYF